MPIEKKPHIVLGEPPETTLYTTTTTGRSIAGPPPRNRSIHGVYLKQQLNQAWADAENERAVSHATRSGVYLEFVSDPNAELVTKSMECMRGKVRLLNIREVKVAADEEDQTVSYATVYVPNDQKRFFAKKIDDYLTHNTASGKPRNQPLIDSISDLRKALLIDSFWSDKYELIPGDVPDWVEVWLSSDNDDAIAEFERLLFQNDIVSKAGVLRFPERAIKVIRASRRQLELLTQQSDHIAEYRLAKATSAFFMDLDNIEQAEWANELVSRATYVENPVSSVCILDTGVNHGHRLLSPLLHEADCQTVEEAWGTDDHNRHGTLMAGTSAYGDLYDTLSSTAPIVLRHRLESVKIMPPPPEQNAPNLWGYITSQAISRAEIQAPERKRVICMAVTAEDGRDQGRPSSWSAALDQITSTAGSEKLVLLSAGNTTGTIQEAADNYPDFQLTDSVHDPAQSWNSLTVGAFTRFTKLSEEKLNGYSPIAGEDMLSPFTTTSATWEENKWPVKPELVLEGGNLAIDPSGFATDCDDYSILSTWYKPQEAHFHPFSMTSAATAQLAWMAAQLRAEYPLFWEETIRGLLVHTAEWPEALRDQFVTGNSKTAFKRLLTICGYGVPDLDRALYSAGNSLTLISQSEMQPFDKKTRGGGYRTKDMHVYELPWPVDVLQSLPDDTPVKMRITLSYFIEPAPGEVGWKDRYRYASHGLRFELNSPGESKVEFTKRINKAARDTDEGAPGTPSPADHWLIGAQARDRGSIHSDIWGGTAAELAQSNLIGISPVIGWWRERSHLNKWDSKARYSLIVSITTPDETVDVYTPVAQQIGLPVEVEVNV